MNEQKNHPLDVALKHSLNGDFDISEKLLRDQPQDDIRVLFNLGWHEMRHGNMMKAFEYLNVGRFIDVFGNPAIPGKIWKDESLKNKTVLFRCEGGFGDQIVNFRFAKNFEEMGARVVISCSSELKELFSRHGYVCVDNDIAHRVYYDYWVPAMSAPYLLNLEYSDIDGKPYINTIDKKTSNFKNKKLNVGIKWSGNPKFEHHQHRKFPPNLMIDLHNVTNTTFYSLQRDDDLIDDLPFFDMKDDMKTWEDTVDIISKLDLVITSCTSIAHIAGAMGIKTWIVVPILPYYVWSVPGEKTNWYDSVKLFRQSKFGKWDDVFMDIKKELIKLSSKKNNL